LLTAALGTVAVLATASPIAHAQAPPRNDPWDRLVVAATPPAPTPPREWHVEVAGRALIIPDALLDSLFRHHGQLHTGSFGIAALWRRPDAGEWRFALDYAPLTFPGANWVEASLPDGSATHLDWRLHSLAVGAGYTFRFPLVTNRLFGTVGVGGGVAVFLGNVYATDIIMGCSEPAATCPHWSWATRRALALPTRVVPFPWVQLGFDVRVVTDLWVRIEGGLYGAPYAGLSLAYRVH